MSTRNKAVQWVARTVGPLTASRRPEGLRVLLYHSVGAPVGPSIPAGLFREHMSWLAKESGYEVVDLEQGADRLSAGSLGPLVAVTFDDGFRDNLVTAAPILQSLHIPFTVFVTAGHIERSGRERTVYLTPPELKELAGVEGATIGAHGYSHRPLTRLLNGELEREMAGAKRYLEDVIGRRVATVSYPHGAVNDRVRQAASSGGFRLGATSFVGLNRRDTPALMMRRTEILEADGLPEFELKLRGGYDWYGVKQRLYWPVPSA